MYIWLVHLFFMPQWKWGMAEAGFTDWFMASENRPVKQTSSGLSHSWTSLSSSARSVMPTGIQHKNFTFSQKNGISLTSLTQTGLKLNGSECHSYCLKPERHQDTPTKFILPIQSKAVAVFIKCQKDQFSASMSNTRTSLHMTSCDFILFHCR